MNQFALRSGTTRASLYRPPQLTGHATKIVNATARALLAEVVARLSQADLPIVQIIAACGLSRAAGVAQDLAAAAALTYGRTLLVTDDGESGQHLTAQRSPGKGVHEIIPDAAVTGLYHRRFDEGLLEREPSPVPTGRTAPKSFRMLVLASRSPIDCPSGLSHATRCHGTIVAVAAGVTRLADVQATARQLDLAGATVLGTVLYDAPSFRLWPGWKLARRCA